MTNTNTSKRDDARARLRYLVTQQTGVEIESADFIELDAAGNRDRFVFCGNPTSLLVVMFYFETTLGVEGCELAAPHADDPEWSCLWVPSAGIQAAIKRASNNASTRTATRYADDLKNQIKE